VDKLHSPVRPQAFQRGEIPGIRKRVQDDELVRGVLAEPVMNEIAADEAGPAGY
jgi:hypothetical protein